MKTPEIREAPVPVRLWWSNINGLDMSSYTRTYFPIEGNEWIYRPNLSDGSSFSVEFSNGQTIIVRAKP